MSGSSSKTKTTQQQQSSGVATSTPNVPDWISNLYKNQASGIGALQASGQPLVSGASNLQNQAFNSASQLSGNGSNGLTDIAALMGLNAGTAGANTTGPAAQTTAAGYNPAAAAGGQGYQAAGQAPVNGYTAAQTTAQGYNPATGSATGYQATNAGSQGYDPTLINPNAAQVGGTTVGPVGQATSRDFNATDLQKRLDPYLSQVLGAYQTDFDATAGQTRAQQSAVAAANGGARNSNNAIRSAVTEGELSRARGAGVAGIQSAGFNAAAALLGQDNDRAAGVSTANAGFQTQGSLAQANLNAQQAQLQAQLQQAGILANQGASNQASQFGANAGNTAALTNAGAQNDAAQFGATAQNQFGLANMDAANQAQQFGAAANNQAGLFNAGAQNDALSQLMGAQTQAGLDYAGRQDAAGQFGAQAGNQSALDLAGRQDAAGQFGAQQQNTANAFNAGATNQNNQFNAGQQDTALQRMLQSAGLLSGIGSQQQADARANIGLQGDLGAEQRNITNQTSEASRMALLNQLLAGIPIDTFTGKTGTTSDQMTGSGTSKTNEIGFKLSDFWKPGSGWQ